LSHTERCPSRVRVLHQIMMPRKPNESELHSVLHVHNHVLAFTRHKDKHTISSLSLLVQYRMRAFPRIGIARTRARMYVKNFSSAHNIFRTRVRNTKCVAKVSTEIRTMRHKFLATSTSDSIRSRAAEAACDVRQIFVRRSKRKLRKANSINAG